MNDELTVYSCLANDN